MEALHALMQKKAVELVTNQTCLGFYNRLFLVPKPYNWYIQVSEDKVIKNLDTNNNKNSFQAGKWITSIDFKDAYFHIPIQNQSMRCHIQGQSYQFKALPFGLSTPPMEFTVVAKEVKLIALQKGIRIHQYLDD